MVRVDVWKWRVVKLVRVIGRIVWWIESRFW